METDGNKNKQKLAINYLCEICDYSTSRKSNIESHKRTVKHIKATIGNKNKQKTSNFMNYNYCDDNYMNIHNILTTNSLCKKSLETNGNKNKQTNILIPYICEFCDKKYSNRTGLWKHKKKCNLNYEIINTHLDKDDNDITDDVNEMKDFMKYLIKENSELKSMMMNAQNQMMEVIKTGTHNNNNNTINNNSHNKAFNLNFFLNETCKNAMNINDFVDSIQLNLSDLERVGDMGFVKGISDIIIKNLNALDVTERPIHCTDKKREVLYVKDEDKWEKDDPENGKVRKVIKKVASKNSKILKDFKEKHPDCGQSISKYSDRYNKLIIEAFGGLGNDVRDNENKIIRNISKAVTIGKE